MSKHPRGRSIRLRRGTRVEAMVMLAVALAFAVAFSVIRLVVLDERGEAPPVRNTWSVVLEADSAYLKGDLPQRVPDGLRGLERSVWIVYELRDERRREAGDLFSDSALASVRCGGSCTTRQVDSVRVAIYAQRAVQDILARSELGVELDNARRSAVHSVAGIWERFQAPGFTLRDLLVVVAGVVLIGLILVFLPESDTAGGRVD